MACQLLLGILLAATSVESAVESENLLDMSDPYNRPIEGTVFRSKYAPALTVTNAKNAHSALSESSQKVNPNDPDYLMEFFNDEPHFPIYGPILMHPMREPSKALHQHQQEAIEHAPVSNRKSPTGHGPGGFSYEHKWTKDQNSMNYLTGRVEEKDPHPHLRTEYYRHINPHKNPYRTKSQLLNDGSGSGAWWSKRLAVPHGLNGMTHDAFESPEDDIEQITGVQPSVDDLTSGDAIASGMSAEQARLRAHYWRRARASAQLASQSKIKPSYRGYYQAFADHEMMGELSPGRADAAYERLLNRMGDNPVEQMHGESMESRYAPVASDSGQIFILNEQPILFAYRPPKSGGGDGGGDTTGGSDSPDAATTSATSS